MIKKTAKQNRKLRVRKKILTMSLPRLSVHRTNKYIYAQLIDGGKTIASVNEKELETKKGTKTEKAKQIGLLIAQKAKKAKVSEVVFDRGGFPYHGRIAAFADGAREGGLQF